MFKKAFKTSSHSQCSGKDIKKLKADVSKYFNPECVDDFFAKNDKIFIKKVQTTKQVIYSTENFPIIVDATGKGDYFPSVYLMQMYPKMLNNVILNPGVENFIFKGANLMWPGIAKVEKEEFKKDDIAGIINEKGKIIAVGALGCDSKEYALMKQEENEIKGIALYILHVIEDKLWETGCKTELPCQVGKSYEQLLNEEKQTQDIVQVQQTNQQVKAQIQNEQDADDEKERDVNEDEQQYEEEDSADMDNQLLQMATKKKEEAIESEESDEEEQKVQQKKPIQKQKQAAQAKKGFSDDEDQPTASKNKRKGKKTGKKQQQLQQQLKEPTEPNEEQQDQTAQQQPTIPIKIMDEYIYEAFMNSLKISLMDKDLPIDSSQFYQNHMLLCKKPNVTLDLKNSSYKKIGKFFQVMSKKEIIEYKDAKKGQNPMISKVFHKAPELYQWEPTISKIASSKQQEMQEEKKSSAQGQQSEIQISQITVEQLFKRPYNKSLDGIFQSNDNEYYTREKARQKLLEYTSKNCQQDKQKNIILDQFLKSIFAVEQQKSVGDQDENSENAEQQHDDKGKNAKLNKNVLDKQQISDDEEEEVKADFQQQQKKAKRKHEKVETDVKYDMGALFKMFESKLQQFHHIINKTTGTDQIKPGVFKGIQITAEKVHNKKVTVISGFENFDIDPNVLASKFQIKFAANASVHVLPGKIPVKQLIVQGNILTEMKEFFENECKMDQKFILTTNKLEKKKKNAFN